MGMRAALIAFGLMLAIVSGPARAAEDGDPAAETAEVAADAPREPSPAGGYVDETQGGAAIVDTEASARQEEEFEDTPLLPQVFLHQWTYEDLREPTPTTAEDDRPVADLSLTQAVHQALAHNPGIKAEQLTPLRLRQDVRRAEAVFDPRVELDASKSRLEVPNPSALAGVATLNQSDFDGEIRLEKKLRTGADFEISLATNRRNLNATFQTLRPQYTSELLFSLNQPLLRNFGQNFAYLLVEITEVDSEAARYRYRAALADFIRQVIEAYWVVVFARQNLVVQEQSHELAMATLRENQERVRVGLLAPVVVKEAESEGALREEQVILARNDLENARSALRQIVYMDVEEGFMPRKVEPVEEPHTRPFPVDLDRALALAFEQRPEIIAQSLDLKSRRLTERVRENQLLPRFDLVANGGFNALSGDPVPVEFQDQIVLSPFGGSYAEAFERLSDADFYSYEFGAQIEIPIGNAAAKAEYTRAKIDTAQARLDRRQLLSDVSLEVQQAVNDVEANMKRIQSTRIARELAEENLRNQQKRLEVGMATTKDVLDFQDDLTQARGNELKAAVDYNVSLAALSRATGTILDRFSVVIQEPGERFVPWWARF
jgi:outer membrane protein TolC